jgi:hypothetical protein
MPEIILIFVVVLGGSKLTAIVSHNVVARNTKLPVLKSILFSLTWKQYKQ